jgi:beta-galactosidase
MRMCFFLIGALSILAVCVTAAWPSPTDVSPRLVVDLNTGWKLFAGEEPHAAEVDFDDTSWDQINLPHTWNANDGQDGGNDYRRGVGWYRRTITLNPGLVGRRLYLQFDGASLKANVYVNGEYLGTHVGGFARFRFDATDALKPGIENVIAVRVDNGKLSIPPASEFGTFFGGLYRNVSLVATDRVQIATMDYASPGVYLLQRQVSAERADVLCQVKIDNHETEEQQREIRVTVFDADGREVELRSMVVLLPAGAKQTIEQSLVVQNPHLWNGVADPYLYRVRVELRLRGQPRDAVEQRLGLRGFRIDPNAGFFLNGRHLDLHGVCRHQDRMDKGWAISADDEAEDLRLIRELGANAIRAVHYQQSDSWYERCDRAGLAVWAEIPFFGEALETPEFIENAKQQMRELIRQNFNHPAIFVWGVGNETRNDAAADKLITQLALLVREEDPTRMSTYASNHEYTDPRNWHTDIIGFNRYDGWYYGETRDLGRFLDRVHTEHAEACVGISEYGVGAGIHRHEEIPKASKYHSEEYQSQFHEETWAILNARPFIWGKFVWVMFDVAADFLNQGDTPGRNDKGLVTYDRKTRKDAFYFYKANWSNGPVLYITSRRFIDRSESVIAVKVYSNAESVELLVNGISQGKQRVENHILRWPKVTLREGQNNIEARGVRAGQKLRDHCKWKYTPRARHDIAG